MLKKDFKNIHLGIALGGLRQTIIKDGTSPWRTFSRFLDQSQCWSRAMLDEYQFLKTLKLLRHANENVPYYNRLFKQYHIVPDDIHTIRDFMQIPSLGKKDVLSHYSGMVNMNVPRALFYKCHTSGTTGTPLTLYRDIYNVGFEHALINRQIAWAGVKKGERIAVLKGEQINKKLPAQSVFWQSSPFENKLILSSYHISGKNILYYFDALKKFKPVALDGYPSSIYALARFMYERGYSIPLKAVLTSSETLKPEHKVLIETVFNCQVFDYYGMAERVAAIHTCPAGNYHVIPEYGLTEFQEYGARSGLYELVGTSLTNIAMPFIRYRTGDIVAVSAPDRQCACGRAYPVVDRIIGRMDDYLVTPNGSHIGRLDPVFKNAQNIVEAQVLQTEIDRVILKIVPDMNYQDLDGALLINRLRDRLGNDIQIELEKLQEIPRGSRGKFKSVISNVPAFNGSDRRQG